MCIPDPGEKLAVERESRYKKDEKCSRQHECRLAMNEEEVGSARQKKLYILASAREF